MSRPVSFISLYQDYNSYGTVESTTLLENSNEQLREINLEIREKRKQIQFCNYVYI